MSNPLRSLVASHHQWQVNGWPAHQRDIRPVVFDVHVVVDVIVDVDHGLGRDAFCDGHGDRDAALVVLRQGAHVPLGPAAVGVDTGG